VAPRVLEKYLDPRITPLKPEIHVNHT